MRKTFLAAPAFAGVLASSDAWSARPKACSLLKGPIKHIVYLQFDNTHFIRDVPYVPSDTERMASWRPDQSQTALFVLAQSGRLVCQLSLHYSGEFFAALSPRTPLQAAI